MSNTQSIEALQAENAELRQRLREPEQIIEAIRNHAVDAFLVTMLLTLVAATVRQMMPFLNKLLKPNA